MRRGAIRLGVAAALSSAAAPALAAELAGVVVDRAGRPVEFANVSGSRA
jgi:hypothetical protein